MNRRTCLTILAVFLLLFLGLRQALASEFTEAFLRLDRMQANTALSGLVCAKPSSPSAGTEAKVAITFPSNFTISSTAGNWTTGTSAIPAGSTPWPGIGSQASGISGRTVTFASNNLTSSTRYCFTFTGSSSTTGAVGNPEGAITTKESDNTTVDTTTIGFHIVPNDQVTVNATVPASPTDFNATLTQTTAGSTFSQDETIAYKITYGSALNYPSEITVEASWSLGTIQGSGTPSDDTLSYVIGSASNGYGSASPVIDTVNRKITWTIPNFPGNTANQTVTFSLKTTGNYTGPLPVDFDVNGRVLGPGTATPYSTVSGIYQFSTPTTPTPTPTGLPGPTSTPGPGATATPTPTGTPAPYQLLIEDISMRAIAATSATVAVATSVNTTATLVYGTDPKNLRSRITDLTDTSLHLMELSDLTPDTKYYFRVTVTDASGTSITSDLFTFTTAKDSDAPKIALPSLIVTSNNVVLYSPLDNADSRNTIVLPQGTTYELQFALTDKALIKSIRLFTRDRNVLGITSKVYATEALGNSVVMLEIKPGVFAGRLKNPRVGSDEIYARIEDYNGNIVEQKVINLRSVHPFTILDQTDNKPVEHAKVTFFIYNSDSKLYEKITQQGLSIQNPAYSEPDGIVPVVLPQAQYRAEIDNLRNEKKTIDFTIGPYPGQDYPTVYLKRAPFSITKTFQYIVTTCADTLSSFDDLLSRLGSSGRFFELNALVILACFVILSVLALASRLRISVHQLPWYFGHLLHHHPATGATKSIFKGKVIDHDSDRPVTGADVFLIDSLSGQVILHTTTNNLGKFSFPLLPVFTYRMEITKPQYHEGHFNVHEVEGSKERIFTIVQHTSVLAVREKVATMTESILGMSFELILFLTFILSIILGLSFGFLEVLPFLILAVVNLMFWLLHRRTQGYH